MKHTEDALQIACANYCRVALPPSVLWWHTPNGGRRNVREAARLKRMGTRPGVPDFTLIWSEERDDGWDSPRVVVAFIELKSAAGRLSPGQRDFKNGADAVAAEWAICRSLDDFVATLRAWGVPTKAMAA